MILLQIGMVSPGTQLVKNHESQSRFQVSYARAQPAKDINLHKKELSITFRRNIRNMLIIGLSSQIAVRAETVNVTAHRVGWNT